MLTKINTKQLDNTGRPDSNVASVSGKIQYTRLTSRCVSINKVTYSGGVLTVAFSNGESVVLHGFTQAADLPTGPVGTTGPKGKKGWTGHNNRDGTPGRTGAMGDRGYRGPIGNIGRRGYKGSDGLVGPKGTHGVPGDIGNDPVIGNVGARGSAGADGEAYRIPIVVSESEPGSLGPGTIWVKPSKFVYGEDKVSFTLVCKSSVQQFNEMQELLTLKQSGIDLPGPWFARDLPAPSREYCLTDSRLLTWFAVNSSAFIVYANDSSFGTSVHIVKSGGLVVGLFEGEASTACVSNVAGTSVLLVIGGTGIIYDVRDEFVEQRFDMPLPCRSVGLLNEDMALLCGDFGLAVFSIQSKEFTVIDTEPCVSVSVNGDSAYALTGEKVKIVSKLKVKAVHNVKADHLNFLDGSIYAFHSSDPLTIAEYDSAFNMLGTHIYERVNGYLFTDALYLQKGQAVYRVTGQGHQYKATVHGSWFIVDNVLVEYAENAIFLEEI